MRLHLEDRTRAGADAVRALSAQLAGLGFPVDGDGASPTVRLTVADDPDAADFGRGIISPAHDLDLLEQAFHCLPFQLQALPLLADGESKEVRLLSDQVVVTRFKPTVYSYTHNRYGVAGGTETVRARFSAEVFRRMAKLSTSQPSAPRSAFLALVDTAAGPVMVQRRVEDSNLEVRVKRYHIGSPVHRYRFTERQATTQACGPLRKWSRFDRPIVCFDWRHPLVDEGGRRLADEPLSDDYAAAWIEDVARAKGMARDTFLWLEALMAGARLVLVDMCMFVDRKGHLIFGEISPDCMRVREQLPDLEAATSFDKDIWRAGGAATTLAERYQLIFKRVFGDPAGAPRRREQAHG